MAPKSRLKLVGMLYRGDPEGVVQFLTDNFPKLVEVKHKGMMSRQVQYASDLNEGDYLHFLSVEVDKIDYIPEGMMAWELYGDTWTISKAKDGQKVIIWQDELTWRWSEQTIQGKICGEFTAKCPPQWSNRNAIDFKIFANSYIGRGNCDDDVHLVNYDPSWSEQFEEMAEQILKGFGQDVALRIEHYGSTSIPDMPAKPVIDILVEIPSFDEARKRVIPRFDRPECECWWYSDHIILIVRKEFLGKRTHHIHLAPAGHRIWNGLKFRDYLKNHPDDASRYAALKYGLAARFKTDRERYTVEKDVFIREVMIKALHEG